MKRKTLKWICGICGGLLAVLTLCMTAHGVFVLSMMVQSDTGIIGGADAPTVLLIAQMMPLPLRMLNICLVMGFLASGICLLVSRKQGGKNN